MPANPLPFEWKQLVDTQAPDQAAFSPLESQATMLIEIDNSDFDVDLVNLPRYILGYPEYKPSGPWNLSRHLPLEHPIWTRMRANKIVSLRGVGMPNEKWTNPGTGMSYAVYPAYRVLINFAVPPYPVLDDTTVTPFGAIREYYRYFAWSAPEFGTTNYTRKGSKWRFAGVTPSTVTPATGLPSGVAANQTLDLGLVLRSPKALLRGTWYQVPGRALFGNDGATLPANIFNALGKVNADYFPGIGGFPPGTLLMLPPKFHPEDAPIQPADLGFPDGYPPRLYNIEYNFEYFNPDVHPTWNGASPYPHRGHLLTPAPNGSAQPYYYLVSSDDTSPVASADPKYGLYQPYDFSKLFQLP